jgi:PilZ domain
MLLPPFRRRAARRSDLRVRLHIPDLGAIDASVERAVVGAAELTLRAEPPIPTRFLNRAGVMLETIPDDLHEHRERTWGRLSAVPNRSGRVDRTRVWFFKTAPPAPKPPQRRQHVRAPLTLPVTFVPERFEVGWLDAYTRDISVGGVLLGSADPIVVGERIRLIVELADHQLIDTQAQVVRELPFGQRAVRIDELSRGDGDRIARLVAEYERFAIAEARAGRRATDY